LSGRAEIVGLRGGSSVLAVVQRQNDTPPESFVLRRVGCGRELSREVSASSGSATRSSVKTDRGMPAPSARGRPASHVVDAELPFQPRARLGQSGRGLHIVVDVGVDGRNVIGVQIMFWNATRERLCAGGWVRRAAGIRFEPVARQIPNVAEAVDWPPLGTWGPVRNQMQKTPDGLRSGSVADVKPSRGQEAGQQPVPLAGLARVAGTCPSSR